MRGRVVIPATFLAAVLAGVAVGSCVARRGDGPGVQATSREDAVRKLVLGFIAAHSQWEQSAIAKDSAPGLTRVEQGICYLTEEGEKVSDGIVADYEKALSPFVAKSVRLRCGGYGTPPKHDPQREEIASMELRDDACVVTTRLDRESHLDVDYEYHIVFENGQPRIAEVLQLSADGPPLDTP